MAILNSIRKRGVFLILIIALALFAFILSDVLTSGGGAPKGSNNIATVNGINIPRQQFMEEVEIAQRNMGPNANTSIAMTRVWDKEVRRIILEEQAEKAGVSVEKGQLDRALKETLAGNPTFLNDAGEVDEGRIQEYIASIKSSSPQMYQQWIQFEEELSQNVLQETYEKLIQGGIRTSITEGKQDYHFKNDKINFSYVMIPYSSIEDDEVTVSDREIESYISSHANEFKTDATADIEYVKFSETPSEEDFEEAKSDVNVLLTSRVEFNNETKANDTIPGFKDVKDYEEFVNTYSEVPYQDFWFFEDDLPEEAASDLIALEKGDVYGPYKDEYAYYLSRVIDTKKLPDSVTSKHILVRFQDSMGGDEDSRTKEEAEKLVDSLVGVLKKTPSKFAELAEEYSDDASKERGGDLGSVTMGRMVKPFEDFIFNNPEGTIGKVETDFGLHVVEVGEQTEPKKALKMATIVKPIEASDKTLNDLFTQASKFEVNVAKEDFNKLAEEENLEVRPVNKIKPMDATIPGVDNNRSIVTWAFEKDTKVGDTKRFSVPDGYIVARVTRKNKEGLLTASDAGPKVKPILIKEKKAKMIREKVSGKSMEEIVKDQKDVTIKNASQVTMGSPNIGGVKEAEVVGYAFGTKSGETSPLIDGNEGVYMVKASSLTPAPNLDNYSNQAAQLGQRSASSAFSKVFEALKKKSKIKDYRSNFY